MTKRDVDRRVNFAEIGASVLSTLNTNTIFTSMSVTVRGLCLNSPGGFSLSTESANLATKANAISYLAPYDPGRPQGRAILRSSPSNDRKLHCAVRMWCIQ